MASLTLLVSLLFNFAVMGSGLKCYSYTCSNSTGIPGNPSYPCSPPRVANCTEYENRCMTRRLKTVSYNARYGKYINSTEESRSCSSRLWAECRIPDYDCAMLNRTLGNVVDCEVGCCHGDLCNNGTIPPRTPQPKGSLAGSDLSCYTCATRDSLGIKPPTYDCDRPVSVTCGTSNLYGMKRDRCMSVTGVYKIGSYTEVVKTRSCSDPYYCNQDFACNSMNASGVLERCNMSCCFGKNCNGPGPIEKPTPPTAPSRSDLSCYSCTNDKRFIRGWQVADADCKSPVKQTCSHTDVRIFLRGIQIHDQCLRMKLEMEDKKHQVVKNVEVRNCSSSISDFCNKNYICNIFNQSGELRSCNVSCCAGDYCNGNPVATSPPSPTTTQSPLSLSPSTNSSQVASMSTRAVLLIGLATFVLVH